MYTTFIRPLLEYSFIVWDGCPLHYVEKLEKVQLYAARITTGLPIISSRESLYLETGWEPLSERPRVAKLNTMYNVHNIFSLLLGGESQTIIHEIERTIPFPNADLNLIECRLFLILLRNGTA